MIASLPEEVLVVYLSGPMTGIADFNRAEFDRRAQELRRLGFLVRNPADISREFGTDRPYGFYLKRALEDLLSSDVVWCFGDISKSRGARLEVRVAKTCHIPVFFEGENK